MNEQKLNFLILEDSPYDAELMVIELEKEGFVLEWKRVDTEKAFKKALSEKPDIILADYKLPSYNGLAAIKLQQKIAPEIPLILVSGTIGEERAVECLKAGATDYVLKDNLFRLSPVLKRALKEAEEHRERKKAEEALMTSNENFQQVVTNITTVVWKADIGKNGAFENTYSSPVLDELLELPAGTMKNDWDKYFGYIKPEYMEHVNNAFKEAIISPGKSIDCEYEVLKGKGQTAWFHSKGRCFEKNGKLHVFGSTTDITERKRIESKLKQNENMLRQIFDTSPNCIFVKDRNGMYLAVNKRMAELHRKTPEEFVGKYDYKIAQQWFETVDYKEFRKAEQDVIDNKKTSFINEELFVYHDGTERWFQTTKVPFELEDNKNCLLVISIDITDNKKAEWELQKRMNELEAFYSVTLGRENRVIELKQEVNDLLEQLGKNKKYRDYN